ncbi:MAG: DUF1292 domain-containing protein [Bacilli bacterium]|nr:DUF1292 domain-containing protein [Bacilli bacterium]
MNNKIKIKDDNGKDYEVEVVDIFNVEGYNDKEYIAYTLGREVDQNNLEIYVSILKQDGDNYSLENIDDEEEWKYVQRAIDEMGEV